MTRRNCESRARLARSISTLLGLATVLTVAPAPAAELSDRLRLSGHLSAAYAWRDSVLASGEATPREFSLGIPEDGTFQYRTLALQVRYRFHDSSELIIQLSHERNGDALVDEFRDEIELDWGFYRHSWANGATLRLGRFPVPFGIFNEIRDVGTVLPAYRPASSVYLEGTFTSETVDGIGWSSPIIGDGDWQLNVDLFAGESETLEAAPFDRTDIKTVRVEDYYGVQLWLHTPWSGLRLGAAAQSKELAGGQEGTVRRPGERTGVDDYLLSLDGDFERFFIRAEYRWIRPEPIPDFFGASLDLSLDRWYAQVGWRFRERWTLMTQYETAVNRFVSSSLVRPLEGRNYEDVALVLNHAISPSLVLKAEAHWLEEARAAFRPVFGPTGLQVEASRVPLGSGAYGLISCAVSF